MTRAFLVHFALALLLFAGGYSLARVERRDEGDQSTGAGRRRVVSALIAAGGNEGARLALIARDQSIGWRTKLRRFFELSETAEPGDLAGLLRAVDRDVPWNLGGRELKAAIFRRWADEDMEDLLQVLVGGDLPRSDSLVGEALRAIAETDLTRAIELLSELSPADRMSWRSKLAMSSVGWYEIESGADPTLCLNLLLHTRHPDRLLSPRAWRSLVRQVARRDPKALLAAEDRIPPGLLSDEILNETYRFLAHHDQEGALLLLRDGNRQDELPDGAVEGIVGAWVKRDPAAAEIWAREELEGETRDLVLQIVARAKEGGR